jgi:protein SCO1/2
MPDAKKLNIIGLLSGLIALGMGIGVGVLTARYYSPVEQPPGIQGMFWPDPKQLYPFLTVDDTGARFGLDRLKGKWSFMFFGYTHCPDVCPITLSVMAQVHEKLQRQGLGGEVQMLFVTVDPERDTTRRLAKYVHKFDSAIIGLGGSMTQIQSLTGQLGVLSVKDETDEHGNYLVDHSTALFLIDPKGRLISLFSAPHDAESIVSRFLRIRDFVGQQA